MIARKIVGQIPNNQTSNTPLAIKGTEGVVISYAKCCCPIPGDPIIGIFNRGRGIIVHRENCKHLQDSKYPPNKYIFITWANDLVKLAFSVELKVEAVNKKSILSNIAAALSDCNANIKNIEVNDDYSKKTILLFKIEVINRAHLSKIIKRLRLIKVVTKVTRVK